MIKLLVNELQISFRADFKVIMKILVGLLIFSTIFVAFSPIAIPIFISYIFIYRRFQLEDRNKVEYFINSLPIEKEDIVYSKYTFALVIILGSVIFTVMYLKVIEYVWGVNFLNFEVMTNSLNILLILISVTFPLIFRYGYSKSYVMVHLLIGVTILTANMPINILMKNTSESLSNIPQYLSVIVCTLIYILSMYISKKSYIKKEIAS